MSWQACILDIRIVEEPHGPPQVTRKYRLVDWETEKPINEIRYDTMGEAEQAKRTLLLPRLERMARAYAETCVSERGG